MNEYSAMLLLSLYIIVSMLALYRLSKAVDELYSLFNMFVNDIYNKIKEIK